MAGLVTHAQETVLGATALEVGPNACCTSSGKMQRNKLREQFKDSKLPTA